jgi:predicted short-subunit dehydrogenase-like oxidoreductase (DUF2520 family)
LKITFVGSGNVAWHLSQALEEAGHSVQEVYSRNIDHAKKLASRLYDAFPTNDLDFTESESTVFFIAVTDDALEEVTSGLRIPEGAIVAHTSGTKPLESLDLLFEKKGVFYPLQTFSKSRKIYFEEIPICIESDNEEVLKVLTSIAKSISPKICYLNSHQRKVLHIAAVFACNFTNHLLVLSKEILDKEELDYKLLDSLISETINKALENDPKEVQTGPAIRKDVKVLQEHLQYLSGDPDKKQLYRLLSESILKKSI